MGISFRGLVGVLSPALRLPEVGGEQEEMNVDFHWHFPDPRMSHGSVIRGMGGLWSKVHCPCWAESWWVIEVGGACGVPESVACSCQLTACISSQLLIQRCHSHSLKSAMVGALTRWRSGNATYQGFLFQRAHC